MGEWIKHDCPEGEPCDPNEMRPPASEKWWMALVFVCEMTPCADGSESRWRFESRAMYDEASSTRLGAHESRECLLRLGRCVYPGMRNEEQDEEGIRGGQIWEQRKRSARDRSVACVRPSGVNKVRNTSRSRNNITNHRRKDEDEMLIKSKSTRTPGSAERRGKGTGKRGQPRFFKRRSAATKDFLCRCMTGHPWC